MVKYENLSEFLEAIQVGEKPIVDGVTVRPLDNFAIVMGPVGRPLTPSETMRMGALSENPPRRDFSAK